MPVAPPQLPSLQAAVKLHMAEPDVLLYSLPPPHSPNTGIDLGLPADAGLGGRAAAAARLCARLPPDPILVLTWVREQLQACWATLLLLPGHAGAYSQQGCWSLLARRAFQTALLHLKPPPKPSCQTRSPRLTPLVCSMFDRMYLRTSNI